MLKKQIRTIVKVINIYLHIVLIICFFTPTISIAKEVSVFDDLERAGIYALEWFQDLSTTITAIVEAEKRTRLLESLSDLSKDLYAIEQDKRVLVQLLKHDQLDRTAIDDRTSRLMESIDRTRISLRKVGPQLLLKHKAGGSEVEALLSNAAIDRKFWVPQLLYNSENTSQRNAIIEEGERAIKALHDANLALTKLMTKL